MNCLHSTCSTSFCSSASCFPSIEKLSSYLCWQDTTKRRVKVDTHLADPLPRLPARTPAPMCRACRCICIHLHPSQPGHCLRRAGSGRRRSQTGTAQWPGGGRPSSSLHREPLSPARTAAAAGGWKDSRGGSLIRSLKH